MAEGLSEIYFWRTAMRKLALALLFVLPCSVAFATPSHKPSRSTTAERPVYLVLVNMSGQRRQIQLKSGVLDLPIGVWTVIDSDIGSTLRIASDTHREVDERIVVKEGDNARILRIL
jgi:hypothetical protein